MNGLAHTSLRLGRPSVRASIPWESLLVSLLLTLVGVGLLAGKLPEESIHGSVLASVLLLLVGTAATVLSPQKTTEIFLAAQVALYLLSNGGVVGNSINTYLSVVIAAVILVKRRAAIGRFRSSPGAALAVGLAVISALQWLRAAEMMDSLPVLLDIIAFAVVLVGWDDRNGLDYRRLRLCFVGGVLVAMIIVMAREYPFEERLGFGLGLNPNYFGHTAALALLFAATLGVQRSLTMLKLATCAVLVTALLASESRTAIYSVAGCILLYALFERNFKLTFFSALGPVALAIIVLTVNVYDSTSVSYRLASPFIDTFDIAGARRSAIWEYLFLVLRDHWAVGVGFGNIPILTANAGLTVYGVGLQSHNMYLSVAVEMGFAGLLLVVLWQLRMLAYGLLHRRNGALLVSVLVYLILEASFDGTNLNFLSGVAILLALFTADAGRHPLMSGVGRTE